VSRAPFTHHVNVRYLEVDQQGVVFNMWYLAYFDDAMTAWMAYRGLPYGEMFAAGFDVQIVHTELDWQGSAGWGDDLEVGIEVERVGTTSFTLRFVAHIGDRPVVTASTVYVVMATDASGKREIPPRLLDALSAPG
jgi:acyl-CoA thioester hydrolase